MWNVKKKGGGRGEERRIDSEGGKRWGRRVWKKKETVEKMWKMEVVIQYCGNGRREGRKQGNVWKRE